MSCQLYHDRADLPARSCHFNSCLQWILSRHLIRPLRPPAKASTGLRARVVQSFIHIRRSRVASTMVQHRRVTGRR